MRRDIIAMSRKERQRYHLLKMVVEKKTTLQDASRLMEVSYRHAKRLKRKLISEGARGLVQKKSQDMGVLSRPPVGSGQRDFGVGLG
jgi:hypothetical protein